MLGANKDHSALYFRLMTNGFKQLLLVHLAGQDQTLVDALCSRRQRRDLNTLWVGQQFFGEVGDFLRHGGRKQARLTRLRDFTDDQTDWLDKAHVQHLVSFVQDQMLHHIKADGALLHQVNQAARGGDQDVDTTLHRADLLADVCPTIDQSAGQADEFAIGAQAVCNLASQFAGWAQDQRAASACASMNAAFAQMVQQGQREGCGLARTGLGEAQNVERLHGRWNGLHLDGGRMLIAFACNGVQDRLSKAEIGKSSHGLVVFHTSKRAVSPPYLGVCARVWDGPDLELLQVRRAK